MTKTVLAAIAFAAAAIAAPSAQAASVNLTRAESSVGLSYTIGFASTVVQGSDAVSDVSDTVQDSSVNGSAASVSVDESVTGFRPVTNERQTASIAASVTGDLSIDNGVGGGNSSVSGMWNASISPVAIGSVAAAGGNALASLNTFNLAFEVLDGPVDILVSFASDRPLSLLRIVRGDDVSPTVQMSGTSPIQMRTLQPGMYVLNTSFALSATAFGGGRTGFGNFSLTFEDTPLTFTAPVPLPAGALLLGTGLIGFASLRRGRKSLQAT